MKLSLTMICKNELDNLKVLYPLIKDNIDEWIVVIPPNDNAKQWLKEHKAIVIEQDFTQPIETEIWQKMYDLGVEIPKDYRLFKFADARNKSLEAATGDYILWLDADDRPKGLENIKKIIEGKEKADQFDVVYDYARNEENISISDHIRERIVKNNGKWKWRGAELGLIHETLMPITGFNPLIFTVDKQELFIEHHSDHANQSSDRNFIALLYEYLKTDGKDARTTYYLATEFFNHKAYKQAIATFQEYIQVGGWDEERYRAWVNMGHAYNQIKDLESSRNAYLSAIKELPSYPDAYLFLGESYHNSNLYEKSIEFLLTGLGKPIPKTKSAIDYEKYAFRPMVYLALNYMQVGKQDVAYSWYMKAKKVSPQHPWVKQYEELFEEIKDLNDYVKAFVKVGQLSQKRYRKNLAKLAEAIPDELMNQELLLDFKRRYTTPKIWPDNSIVFWCSSAFEDWGPDSLKTGTGGSEEAIIQLAPRLAKLGWDVTVYNNCPKEETRDGVKWTRFERFNPRDIFNVLISWRNNAFIVSKVANKKLIDVHDVPMVNLYPNESMKDVVCLVKSQYHRSLFEHLPDENFVIIPNGIDTTQFNSDNKTKNNLVWTSSYDRGLEYLLEMWPDIKKSVPDATLDVAYGFNLFDASPRGQTDEGKQWKQKMLNLLDQVGIAHHGRLDNIAVSKLYNQAEIWAYPTDFPEIDCITATKAMAAKCVPITTDYAVMKERNQGIMIEGSIHDNKEDFKNRLIELLKDDKLKKSIRDKVNVEKYDWSNIAQQWDTVLRG